MILLKKETEGSQICWQIGRCANNERALYSNLSLNFPNQCLWCKTIVNEFKDIQTEEIETEIKDTVDHLCNQRFPPTLAAPCSSFFDGLTDYIFGFWKNLLVNDAICSDLKLC